MWQAIPAVISAVGSYMSSKNQKDAAESAQEAAAAQASKGDYLRTGLGELGMSGLDMFTSDMLQKSISDVPMESLQLGASPYEDQVGEVLMQMLGSGRGLSDEQLALETQVQEDQDLRSRENMQKALQDAMFGAQKLGVTTGGKLGGITNLADEQSRISAEAANQYKLGTMNADFARMNEALGRGLGLSTLTGAREEGNINRQYQEEQARRSRPYQLLEPAKVAASAYNSAPQASTYFPGAGASPIASGLGGGLAGYYAGQVFKNNDGGSDSFGLYGTNTKNTK